MPFRKPLVVVAPKKLLRYKGATSKLEDFSEGTRFKRVLKDSNESAVSDDKMRKVVFCSGQVYFDLEEERAKKGLNDTAICRVESLCPFPFRAMINRMDQYPNASVTWAQEEPKNAGAWSYMQPRIRNMQKHLKRKPAVDYAGRPIMAAAAVGFTKDHNEQLAQLI